jgi:hypothetical protein
MKTILTRYALFLIAALLSAAEVRSAPSYAASVLADGPIAYWRFSGATAVATNSGSLGAAANGSYINGATTGAEAPRPPVYIGFEADNTALQLDGVDDFVRSAPMLLNNLSNVTMSGWIRRAGAQRGRTGLWGQDNLIEFGYIDNGTVQAWVDNFSTPVNVATPFPDLEWDHLALVVNGATLQMTVYTNGQAAGSAPLPSANYNSLLSTNFFIIGGDTFGNGVSFGGQIDEVALFDKALSAAQIANHYFNSVAIPPSISRQPEGTNIFEGQTLTLSVGAVGTPTLQYQWLFFGAEIPGQNAATLSIVNASAIDSGSYSVRVTNPYGSVESAVVEVNVSETQPPTITQQPQSITRYAGRTARFTVVATGGANLLYQWQLGSADIPNATGPTLTLNNISAANAGTYRVVVRNTIGSITSDPATLGVVTPTPNSYESAVLADNPLAYWRLGEASGSTAFDYWGGYDGTYVDAQLGVAGALFGDANTAAGFNGTSSAVTTPLSLNGLSVLTMTGWIRRAGTQAGRTGLFGQNDLVEFGYIDNDTLQLWVDNFETPVNINPNPFPDGEWDFIAVVVNNGAMAVYTNATVGGTASLGSSDYGTTAFHFNIGGGGIFDATGNYFSGAIDEVAVFDHALTGNEIANLYFTGSHAPPAIAAQPQGTNLFEGSPLTLCVGAVGAPPLSYKWLFFGNEIPGQTGACLTIASASLSDSGSYQVEVSSPFGTALSAVAEVIVNPASPPVITVDPQSATRYAGGSVSFTGAAVGTLPITYQWQLNGADIPGATATTLTRTGLQASDGGAYRLIAANASGRATSAVATLTIIVPPAGSYSAAVLAHQPLAYWRLGETSGDTAFDYAGGNHGTYNNVLLGLDGALVGDPDKAAGFDGTSSFVSTPVSLNGLPNVTVTGWIQRNGPQGDRTGLFGQNDLIEFGYINNDTIQAWVDNFEPHVDLTPNPIPDQQWGFIALTLNNGELSVQVNDGVDGTATLPSGNYGSSTFKFNIGGGGIFDAAGNFFNGRIDEVALFNRALTASELDALYQSGLNRNEPPTGCVAAIVPDECTVPTIDGSQVLVISLNGTDACVTLQGSAVDPDGGSLQYSWSSGGVPFASGAVVTNCLDVGCYAVTFTATDTGGGSCSANLNFCVATAGDATEQCIALVAQTDLPRLKKRPLIASLRAAVASFDRGDFTPGLNQLKAFQNKVRSQVGPDNPAAAEAFINCAQRITDAIACSAVVAGAQ